MISGRVPMDRLESIDILKLLPQRRPFVMVDRLRHCDPVVTTTEFTVTDDCIFNDGGYLSAAGVCENIAQTCAARMGYMSYASGQPVRLGFIGAVNNFGVKRAPAAGETLLTTIEVQQEVFNITLVHATVKCADETVAEADLKIALGDEA